MRITSLVLEGYAGLLAGAGAERVRLKLGKSGPPFVMLAGRNGSGKTTILSAAHPLPGAQDDRGKRPVPEGREGRKLLRATGLGSKWEFEVIWKPKGAPTCHVRRDGEELNPNGGVKTYEDVLRSELGLDESYFRLGRLGPNVRGFVEMPASERKEYVSKNLLPGMEEYDEAYEAASENRRVLRAALRLASDKLGRLPEASEAEGAAEALRSSLEAAERREARARAREAARLEAAAAAREGVGSEKVLARDLAAAEAAYRSARLAVAGLDGSGEAEVAEALEKWRGRLQSRTTLIGDEREDWGKADALAAAAEARLQEARARAERGLRTIEREKELRQKVEEGSRRVLASEADAQEALWALPAAPSPLPPGWAPLEAAEPPGQAAVQAAQQALEAARAAFPTRLMEEGRRHPFFPAADREYAEALAALQEARGLEREAAALQERLAPLEKRPADCTIGSCAFIASALAARKKLKGLGTPGDVQALQRALEKAEERREEAHEADRAMEACARLLERARPLASLHPAWASRTALELLGPEGTLSPASPARMQRLLTARAVAHAEQEKLAALLERLEEAKRAPDGDVAAELAKAERKHGEAMKLRAECAERLEAASAKVAKAKARVKELEELLEACKSLAPAREALAAARARSAEAAEAAAEASRLDSEAREASAEAREAGGDVRRLRGELAEAERRLAEARAASADREAAEKDLAVVEVVCDALDRKKGIPLVFAAGVLESARAECNRLLSVAHGGGLAVDALELTEKEFLIPLILPSGARLGDVRHASQGEQALVGVALSLALLASQAGQRGWNVLCLDEQDGALDTANRAGFVEMVREMASAVGIEQVLVISHNQAFYEQQAQMVLLPGAEWDNSDELLNSGKKVVLDLR